MKHCTRRSMLKKGIQGLLLAATAGLSKISTAATADTAPHAENPRRWPGWGNGEYKKPLVIIHDGAIEEFMAIPLAVSQAIRVQYTYSSPCLFQVRQGAFDRVLPLCKGKS